MTLHTQITHTDVLRRALEIAEDTTATADEAFARAKHEAETMDEGLDPCDCADASACGAALARRAMCVMTTDGRRATAPGGQVDCGRL